MRSNFKLGRMMIAAAALSLAAASPAWAKWPTPAAGASASGQPEVLFTFDDGPHNKYSVRILDQLKKRGIQAIFFWVGHRAKRGGNRSTHSVIERALDDGHVIGTHTVNHVHLCQVAESRGGREIDEAVELYRELTQMPMILFRAPYGDHCRRAEALLKERGLEHFHWDIDPREWKDHDSKRVAEYVIKKLRRLDGRAVVLMHDTKLVTAKAFPMILNWIEAENLRRSARPSGKKPIRILTASDLLAEHTPTPFLDWMRTASGHGEKSLVGHISRLVPGYPSRQLSAVAAP